MSNIILNAGSGGSTLGTDLVAGVDYQKVKVTFSTDGTAPVSVDATHPLPVVQTGALPAGANVIGAVTQSGTWTVTQSGSWTVTANAGTGTFTTSDTHFPATGALSDALTNPTVTAIGSYSLGWDATNTVWRRLQVDAGTGTLKVDPGTVTLAANSSVNLTQAGGNAINLGTGNTGTGTLRVVLATDQPSLTNAIPVAQSGSWTVTSNQGTAAAGSGAWPVTVTDTTNTVVKPGDSTNNAIRVNVVAGGGSGGTSSSFSAAFPATGTAAGASDGTNMKPLLVDGSGFLKVNVAAGGGAGGTSIVDGATFTRGTTSETPAGGAVSTSAPSLTNGTAGALSLNTSGGLRVDGSGVTQPISAASLPLPTNASTGVAQGSTTSGEVGTLVQGAVTTAAPTYTTAQTSPLSLDTAGNLRVTVTNGIQSGTAGSPNANVLSVQGISSMTPIVVDDEPVTTGGWTGWSTPNNNSNAPLTAKALVKGSAGKLGGYIIYNPNTSVAYVQVFDAASTGAVTLGTTRPNLVIPIPASSGANLSEIKWGFTSGMVVAATTTDSGSTTASTGLTCSFTYK